MTEPTAAGPQPMSDRRFITVLISALAAVFGAALILIALLTGATTITTLISAQLRR